MNDKMPMFMVLSVALVGLVGLIIVLSQGNTASSYSSSENTASPASSTDSITGNVAFEGDSAVLNSFGKIFFSLFLVGVAAYMYFRNE